MEFVHSREAGLFSPAIVLDPCFHDGVNGLSPLATSFMLVANFFLKESSDRGCFHFFVIYG